MNKIMTLRTAVTYDITEKDIDLIADEAFDSLEIDYDFLDTKEDREEAFKDIENYARHFTEETEKECNKYFEVEFHIFDNVEILIELVRDKMIKMFNEFCEKEPLEE